MISPDRVRLRTRAAVELRRWRRTLTARTRRELRDDRWRDLPLALIGLPIHADAEAEREVHQWHRDLEEYINAHEEVGFFLQQRSFHICRAHAAARAVIATGVIPAGFTCPRSPNDGFRATCPFAAASTCAGGAAIRLVPLPRAPSSVASDQQ